MAVNINTRLVPYIPRNKRIYSDGTVISVEASQSNSSSNNDKNYFYTQGVPSTDWTIVHNLGKYPSVTVVDTAGTEVEGEVRHIDVNTVQLLFSAAFAGNQTLN